MKRYRYLALALTLATVAMASVIRLAQGSDHQDTPDVELNPASDMTDVYVFPGASPDRTVLVLNSWAFVTPAQTMIIRELPVCMAAISPGGDDPAAPFALAGRRLGLDPLARARGRLNCLWRPHDLLHTGRAH